jgi:protein-S-isoprenylcysteine O-methyltransferase Ste14
MVGPVLTTAWPAEWLFALRNALFLGPLAAAVLLMARTGFGTRQAVGALFSLLYGLSLVFVGHTLAIELGVWRYGGKSLQLLGFPADIWFGGALLWGPVLFLAFPRVSPFLFVLPCTALNGLMLPALTPFFVPGHLWFAGVVLVFLTAHLPALYLARWTAEDRNLPMRAFLLAVGYGGLAFFVMPTIIMHAMGGDWSALAARPDWGLALAVFGLGVAFVMGLSAVQFFALHGDGTPIPLDPTKRLVRTGLYAYVSNPMQLATAGGWVVLGAALGNIWVILAAGMAVCFVLGMVRWHHRQDLEVRFPDGWPAYRRHVGEWRPRWRPWLPEQSRLAYDPSRGSHRRLVAAMAGIGLPGLQLVAGPGPLRYREPNEERDFRGIAAIGKLLNHGNLATAMLGAGVLLIVLPLHAATGFVVSVMTRSRRPLHA